MKVALGVTGCIAAYKAVEILRGLQKRGVEVQVLMTRHATEFVGPLTFQSISGLPVITEMFAPSSDPEIKHIQVAQSIDLLLVAPATANALAKFANGIADDFLSTVYISTTAAVLVAPAMNVEMWAHPATQENVRRLRERGVHFVDPGEGYLACKTVGAGRLAEPYEIVERAWQMLGRTPADDPGPAVAKIYDPPPHGPGIDLSGERVLITAGPTYEAIDPVRGITNRSSGKMGYALAEAALKSGAEVTLVSGPVALAPPGGARTIRVKSAAEMHRAVMDNFEGATLLVMSAAVSDYRPVRTSGQKIKKSDGNGLVLELEQTEDILAAVGRAKTSQIVVGFAAETENVVANARKKLLEKGADLIIANDVSASDSGFDVDTNRITFVSASETTEMPLLTKREAADRILEAAMRIRQSGVAQS
ncbi:MAG TPA: bifunctional phosphopantothenoylcysteine decarboxylase/phosphopantothenate--cysteine ligase CoaBC [Blastocatellia bacterium]|nr:bifunctional phosphopantothenoylcysteine decarboxylase/phosphopantothenate--cysteine ligase CoaBC [Blastocatellia bacterium]